MGACHTPVQELPKVPPMKDASSQADDQIRKVLSVKETQLQPQLRDCGAVRDEAACQLEEVWRERDCLRQQVAALERQARAAEYHLLYCLIPFPISVAVFRFDGSAFLWLQCSKLDGGFSRIQSVAKTFCSWQNSLIFAEIQFFELKLTNRKRRRHRHCSKPTGGLQKATGSCPCFECSSKRRSSRWFARM